MAESARIPLQHGRQSGIMQDWTTTLANTPGSGRYGRAGVPMAISGNGQQGGLPLGVPNVSAPSAMPNKTTGVELGDRFPRRIKQDGVHAEMHHGHQFLSSAKNPLPTNSNPASSRERLASSVDDVAAVLARGFDTSPTIDSSRTKRPEQKQHSQPPPGGDNVRFANADSGTCATRAKSGANIENMKDNSPQRVRGKGAAVASGKRSTRAQKKTAKKWLSKRQERMPDGAPTAKRGTLS